MTNSTISRLVVVAMWGLCLYLTFTMGVYDQDILAEKVVAAEVVEGGNPHLPLEDIGGDGTFAAPRTPGALLLLVPFATIPDDILIWGVTVLNVSAIVAVAVLSLRLTGRSVLWVVAVPLVVLSVPGLYMARGTNLAPVVGFAVVSCWYLIRDRDSAWAGVPLGIAATMRLFPLWVGLALLVGGRKRAALSTFGLFAGVNLAGLALPAITLEGTVSTLSQTVFYEWGSNLSMAALLHPPIPNLVTAAVILVGLAGWLLTVRPDWKVGMMAAPIALLAGPVTWPMYLATVGPFIPAVFIPIIVLWYLPLFGVPQEPVLALSVVLMVGARLISQHRTSYPVNATSNGPTRPH